MNIINLILGIVLLTIGKRLYWLLVGVVGFVIGLTLATEFVQLNPPWLIYVVALAAGIIGALLAVVVQRLAIAVVGFIVGGYGAMYLASLLGLQSQPFNWIAFVLGGIVGLLLVAALFDWALYILSAWAGATLVTKAITDTLSINQTIGLVIFFVLFVLGVVLQAGLFKSQPKPSPAEIPPATETQKKKD